MNTVEEVKGYTAYELASHASCLSPDALDSAGAALLCSVRDQVVEAWEADRLGNRPYAPEDVIHEIADSAPDVYTYTRWREFTDLGGWEEELEWSGNPSLTDLAGLALYEIAYRLASVLVDQLTEQPVE